MAQNNLRSVVDLGVVRDDGVAGLQASLRHAADRCDIVITSGGVSVGSADHVKAALKCIGQVMFCAVLCVECCGRFALVVLI